jgi:hypothetical protein
MGAQLFHEPQMKVHLNLVQRREMLFHLEEGVTTVEFVRIGRCPPTPGN